MMRPAARIIFTWLATVSLVLMAGCAPIRTDPITVLTEDGQVFRGSVEIWHKTGIFSVTDGTTECSGSYDSRNTSADISMPLDCSDGRRGIAIITRDPDLRSGHGTVRMDDGTGAVVIFGPYAEEI